MLDRVEEFGTGSKLLFIRRVAELMSIISIVISRQYAPPHLWILGWFFS
jgi:hypothetical protein